jgi:hypothetical protein
VGHYQERKRMNRPSPVTPVQERSEVCDSPPNERRDEWISQDSEGDVRADAGS